MERWRFERVLPDGTKITVTIEGKVSGKKVHQLVDLFEILSSTGIAKNADLLSRGGEKITVISGLKPKFLTLIVNFFSRGEWFKSKDIQKLFEDIYNEKVKLSTVSTYLSRLFYSGHLERRGSRAEREYKVRDSEALKALVTNYS